MQSTKHNPSLSAYTPAKSVAPEAKKGLGIDRSFAIACGLGIATVIFGFAALFYQFAPEINKFKNNSSQGETPELTFYS
jgi:hypothetical protein